ncbi:hypothetical protein K437DRAFT_262559 [Tilletiaria anomala UBC 951]|uniref:Uncharacterized protein n=1 Tax=Tilletiaria anomala (strain ATCC 24038 / CBS 436.72 / UBC 951) TaxID=1037660 RepID=A0A066VZ56_TILAU|nr:uncharacterized protein K437DRAFT_262559 [Tilletiaria anomala UBC 951]KDN47007.1 hypothetical protein K437DRAFT_262559 [Tilletiaria anomala UBC 951]
MRFYQFKRDLQQPKLFFHMQRAAYVIGQRTCQKFSQGDRIFIAWLPLFETRLLPGFMAPHDYPLQKWRVHTHPIKFVAQFSRLFSGGSSKVAADEADISLAEFKVESDKRWLHRYQQTDFEKGNESMFFTVENYGASLTCGNAGDSSPQGVDTMAEQPCMFVDAMFSNGRWMIVLFWGRGTRDAKQKERVSVVIDVLAISSTLRTEVELTKYHPVLRAFTTIWHQPDSAGLGKKALSQDYRSIVSDCKSLQA